MNAHVLELFMYHSDLSVFEAEWLSVTHIFDRQELVDHKSVSVLFIDVLHVGSDCLVVQEAILPLFWSVVQDSATQFEQVFGWIFCKTIKLAVFSVNKEIILLLLENSSHLWIIDPDISFTY